ncbi:MAG: STAS domain-containing protein [Nocardioides sp.]
MPRATQLVSPPIPPAPHAGSVSLLVDADGQVLVVLHGSIDSRLQPEIRELVDDLVTNRADTTGLPVRVLAENVTAFELAGVWLLLELRRAARPASVTVVAPSPVVQEAMQRHGIQRVLVEQRAAAGRSGV